MKMLAADLPCPCTSGNSFGACCGPFLEKGAFPGTSLQLMRSRYSAYALVRSAYLVDTVVRSRQADHPIGSLTSFSQSADWRRLDILDTDAGGEGDERGVVEFQAWYLQGGKLECIRERSLFFREEGRWKYSHGFHAKPQVGRNDPCPCGSGKKYKKCHG